MQQLGPKITSGSLIFLWILPYNPSLTKYITKLSIFFSDDSQHYGLSWKKEKAHPHNQLTNFLKPRIFFLCKADNKVTNQKHNNEETWNNPISKQPFLGYHKNLNIFLKERDKNLCSIDIYDRRHVLVSDTWDDDIDR
jgi:hypothetical protein